jgi:NitT/TauT family transport system substrate-binding protein
VTHFIDEQMSGEGMFEPVRFSGFPPIVDAMLSGNLDATFILAPLAMSLAERGKPIRIVHLGHRDGTALMVHKDSNIERISDLRGKKIAFPSRYSNQYLILFKALHERGMSIDDIQTVEMPPPQMPAALAARGVDGIIAGEPIMAKTQLEDEKGNPGYGRVLFLTNQVWPEFISCVLAVRQDVIDNRRDDVQRLVDGIARSGLWLDSDKDTGMRHRMMAADFVSGPNYYNYDPKLLRFVLSTPIDRVKYTNLTVQRENFEEIEKYAKKAGVFQGTVKFEDYTDTSFVPTGRALKPWEWEGKK